MSRTQTEPIMPNPTPGTSDRPTFAALSGDPIAEPEERFDFSLTLIAPRGPSSEARRRQALRRARAFRSGDLGGNVTGGER